MTQPDTYNELLAEIYGPRRELIKAFHFFEGRANSKRLFDEANAPRSSKHHYLSTLSVLGLIEKVGTEHGQGGEAFVWELTDRGQQVADDVMSDDTTTISDLAALEQRITALERRDENEGRVDHEQVKANSAAIEKLRDDIDHIINVVETIRDGMDEEDD